MHLYIGEEAIAAGVMPLLGPDDAIVSTYREHGHALARGVPMGAVMAEMFGKVEGCSRGRGGSMHLFDVSRRFYGGNAIVAGGIPIAIGLALADQMKKRTRVTACLFGDGAVAEGEFHESMNLAALWKLPVLFLCENNQYAMGTALERHQSQPNLALKAQSYKMEVERVDGMDVLAVEAATRARRRIRARAATGRASSSFSPTASARTRRTIRSSTGRRTRCESGRSAIRSRSSRRSRRSAGSSAPTTSPRSSATRTTRSQAAVAFADAGTLEPVADLTKNVCARAPTPRTPTAPAPELEAP